jgi:hypothetical protein
MDSVNTQVKNKSEYLCEVDLIKNFPFYKQFFILWLNTFQLKNIELIFSITFLWTESPSNYT